MMHYIDSELFGGGMGHARLDLVIPKTEENQKLVNEVLDGSGVPYHYENRRHRMADKEAVYEPVIVVGWSWWPSDDGAYFEKNPHVDGFDERKGKHFNWDPKKLEALGLLAEERLHKGYLGEKRMQYGPSSMVHQRNLSEDQAAFVAKQGRYYELNERLESLKHFKKKLNPNTALSLSQHMLEALSKHLPSFMASDDGILVEVEERINVTLLKKLIKENKALFEGDLSLRRLVERVHDCEPEDIKISDSMHLMLKNLLPAQYQQYKEADTFTVEQVAEIKENIEQSRLATEQELNEIGRAKSAIHIQQYSIKGKIDRAKKTAELLYQLQFYLAEVEVPISLADLDEKANVLKVNDLLKKEHERLPIEEYFPDYVDNQQVDEITLGKLMASRAKVPVTSLDEEGVVFLQAFVSRLFLDGMENISSLQEQDMRFDDMLDTHGKYQVIGASPDNVGGGALSLPFALNPGERGLALEPMLRQMRKLATTESFDIDTLNCSKTIGKIVASGISDLDLRMQFEDDALGYIGNPQMVLNNFLRLGANLRKNSYFSRAWRFVTSVRPLSRAQGWIIGSFLDEKTSGYQQVAAAIASPFVLTINGAVSLIQKLATPLKTYRQLTWTAEYLASKAHPVLNPVLLAFVQVARAVMAVPAVIEKGVRNFFSGVVNFFRRVTGLQKKQEKMGEELAIEIEAERLGKDVQELKQEQEHRQAQDMQMRRTVEKQIIEIKGKHPKQALEEARQTLNENPQVIIRFEHRIEKKILDLIHDEDDEDMLYYQTMHADICQKSLVNVKRISRAQRLAERAGERAGFFKRRQQQAVDPEPPQKPHRKKP